eukprot:TRINITY_DN30724_c0_g1_i1.p1 TRINITY_DN30724_c0_g1~~TRINITY_DN30724_c0_g1_i1.p1  ORF type:complete len:470 (+),score=98.03 TRINITY_DN30724_c0_g1_i1:119-1528(+)
MAAGLFVAGPLDPDDAFEGAARMNYERLKEEVFDVWAIELDSPELSPRRRSLTIAQLQCMALAGSEEVLKSVCLGLVYTLLTADWCSPCDHGVRYMELIGLLRTLDDHAVLVRSLVVLAHRWQRLRDAYQPRVLAIVDDMLESFWPDAELVLLALQRAAYPGAASASAGKLLPRLAAAMLPRARRLAGAGKRAGALTFLWALRWVAALRRPSSLELEDAAPSLRADLLRLVAELYAGDCAKVLEGAGPALLWALLHCRDEPETAHVWQRASQDLDVLQQDIPQACLDHFLSEEERTCLGFIVDNAAAETNGGLHAEWFLERFHGVSRSRGREHVASDTHLADVTLCALSLAEQRHTGVRQQAFWTRLWVAACASAPVGAGEARFAFLFAARRQGYGREAFAEMLQRMGSSVISGSSEFPNAAKELEALPTLARILLPESEEKDLLEQSEAASTVRPAASAASTAVGSIA